jgi:putative transposase
MFAIKRELKLNKVEISLMRGNAGFKRFVYNFGLELLTASWSFEDIKASDSKRIDAIKKILTQVTMQKPEYAWMREYPSTVYQSAFIDLKNAFSRWRKGLGEFPKKKTNTVSRTAEKWFVAFTLDTEKIPPIIHPIISIGVDLGVKTLATCSDATFYDMPLTTKKAKIKLGKQQWRNRQKVLGNKKLKIKASNKAKKYYIQLSRQHAHIANIRLDTTQKMTTDISRKAAVIRIEDLNVFGMIANHKLASAVSNNCFHEIRRQFTYKQPFYGTRVELVDRWYPSSKMCSKCGYIQSMGLSERVYNCGGCGHVQDRDENASINLRDAPLDKIRLA